MTRFVRTLQMPLGGALAERLALSSFFLAGTFLGAFVEIPLPFTPVPLTLQTLFVLLGGAWLGRSWGAGVQGAYLALGGLGAGVFAGAASGLVHLTGPTAGYLWAFLPAAALVGRCYPSAARRGLLARVALFAGADALVLASGAAWLGWLLHLSPAQALLMGVAPFLPGEALKVALAAQLGPRPDRI